jgi:hypothetical protein
LFLPFLSIDPTIKENLKTMESTFLFNTLDLTLSLEERFLKEGVRRLFAFFVSLSQVEDENPPLSVEKILRSPMSAFFSLSHRTR